MPEVTNHPPGSFCWIELGTTDPAAAKEFYSGLFGWVPEDSPAGPDMVYTMLRLKGLDVGAMYELREDQQTQGVPPHWMTYISVASADDGAKKVASLGGQVILDAFDVMDVGRMAIVQDPQGAAFCLWQAKAHAGFKIAGEAGTVCWDELWTTDRKKAAEFYTGLFGWTYKESDMGDIGVYTEWQNGGTSIGGMLEIGVGMEGVPPNWLPYFMVDDCDATASKAEDLGGELVVPPTDIPHAGRFSVIRDPQGAAFAIIKLTRQA